MPHESFPGAVGPAALDKLRAFSTCEISDALIALKIPSGGYIPGASRRLASRPLLHHLGR